MKKSEALDILGLRDGASDDDVKKAHRQKIRENHPDRFTNPVEKTRAEEKTKLINEARDVLISRKWDPEFGPRASHSGTYDNPYDGNPFNVWPGGATAYTSQGGAPQGQQADPFYGMPFTYVWTSWDNVGTGQATGAGGRQTADPFSDPFDPFSTIFTQVPRKSAKQQYEEARKELRSFGVLAASKAGILALCAALGGIATGMFIYLIATVLYAISREVQGCSSILVVPFVVIFGPLLMLMMPSLGAGISTGLIVFFAIAVAYDIGTLRRMVETMRTYKEKAKIEQ